MSIYLTKYNMIKIDPICPLCLLHSKKNVKLKVLRMNFTRGAVVCPSKNCPYPFVNDGTDKFVNFDGPPEIDRSTLASSEGSWSSVLEQINNLINPLKDSNEILKQADQTINNIIKENSLEEFSSYASDFLDSFVKECEIKYSKNNENFIETLCFDLENKSMSSSMLEQDLDLSLLSISSPPEESVSCLDALTNLDCFKASGRQQEPAESEESNSRNNTSAGFEGMHSVFDINSKNTNNKNKIEKSNISQKPSEIISNLPEQHNNSKLETVHCNSSLNSSDSSSNKVDGYDSDKTGSNEALKYKTRKLSCAKGNTLSETLCVNKSSDVTKHFSNVIQPDNLSAKMLPVGNCKVNNQPSSYEKLQSVCVRDETNTSTGATVFKKKLPISDRPDEDHKSIVIMFEDTIKQDDPCNTDGLPKEHKNKRDCCLPTIGTNADVLTASIVSGQEGSSGQNCGKLSTQIDDLKLINSNKLTKVEVNNCSVALTRIKLNTTIKKSQSSSECDTLPDYIDSLPLSERCKKNSFPTPKKPSYKTINKVKGRTMEILKLKFPKVSIKSQICTRSASKNKQAKPIDTFKLNDRKNGEICKMALENSDNNINYKHTDESDVTLDLPFKHISDAIVSNGSSFTVEQSNFSLLLDDFKVSPQKNELCSSYDQYSKLNKNKLIDLVKSVKKYSSTGIKDDFVETKTYLRHCIDRRRRPRARNITNNCPNGETSSIFSNCKNEVKSEELETSSNTMPTIFDIDDDSIDDPVEGLTGIDDLKNSVKNEPDTTYKHSVKNETVTFKHSDYTYNKKTYKGAKALKRNL